MTNTQVDQKQLERLQNALKQYIVLCRDNKVVLKDEQRKQQYLTYVEQLKLVNIVMKKGDNANEADPVLEKNIKILEGKLDQLLAIFDQF